MRRVIIVVISGLVAALIWWRSPEAVYRFAGVSGPAAPTIMVPPVAADWRTYSQGGDSRMALLLTDPQSAWTGLAHGLKSIGVPFIITTDYRQALKHKVIYVYPNVTGRNLSPEALASLARFTKGGGTLIAQHVLGGELKDVLGFEDATPSAQNIELHFAASTPATVGMTAEERIIRIGSRKTSVLGTYAYTKPLQTPIATYEDGTAAITRNGAGNAYALGVDIGYFLLRGYNNRQQDIASHYVNAFEPTLDVLLRCIKNIYLQGQKNAVTLASVPNGKQLAVLLTHDIDYTRSLVNALNYARYERAHNITATYFMQTKYVRDWNDDIFFTAKGVENLRKLQALGMEIASHSVSHSRAFSKFPLGDGLEQYPSYVPFVKDKQTTLRGTILGELRVSRFLLEHFLPNEKVISFRPGHLSNPYVLPEALTATGFHFSSSVTADDSLTHLPFQLMYSRSDEAETQIFEFPVTVEDEAEGPMIDRLPQAIALAKNLARYGGLFDILIHPDILGQKFEFEQKFVDAMGEEVWYGSLAQLGAWWAARNKIGLDVAAAGRDLEVDLLVPEAVRGLTLDLPDGMRFVSSTPVLAVEQRGNRAVIQDLSGDARLVFRAAE
ncbi:MAG: polysaccharide deacetylase family protein [Pseudomonadota bacterium]|nr:polysaccharide deacetylase family protein [Pseudomonadota bacterium]